MRKNEAEKIIRYLCHVWHDGLPYPKPDMPSFEAFKSWLDSNGYSHYLKFQSFAGPDYDAELWFDQELKQTWRR